jgi:PAS domain-containing protein
VFAIHGLDPLTHFPRIDTALDAYHPEDSSIVENMIDRAIREKGSYDFRLRITRPGGEIRFVRSQGQCELDKQGNVIAMFGVIKDITQESSLEMHMVDIDEENVHKRKRFGKK